VAGLQPGGRAIEAGSRAIVLTPALITGKITIGVANVPPERRREIADVLNRNIRNVSIVGPDSPARFMVDLQGNSIRLLTAEGLQVVGVFPIQSGQWGPAIAQAVARVTNAADLLGLDNLSAQLALRVNIANRSTFATHGIAVVADTQPARLHVRHPDEPRSPQNSLQLQIEVSSNAYVTVVDVDSEGGVNLLFPNDYQQPTFHGDGGVRARERILIPDSLQPNNRAGFYWDYSPPRGVDTLRVFAATDPATAETIRQRVRAMRQSMSQIPGMAARGISQDVGSLRTELTHLATRGITVVPSTSNVAELPISTPAVPSDWTATSLTIVVSDAT